MQQLSGSWVIGSSRSPSTNRCSGSLSFAIQLPVWSTSRDMAQPTASVMSNASRGPCASGMSESLETSGGYGLTGLIFHQISLFKNDQWLHQLRLLLDEGRHGLCRSRIVIIQHKRHAKMLPGPVAGADCSTHNHVTVNQVESRDEHSRVTGKAVHTETGKAKHAKHIVGDGYHPHRVVQRQDTLPRHASK